MITDFLWDQEIDTHSTYQHTCIYISVYIQFQIIYTHAFDKNKKAASHIMQSRLETKLSSEKLCPVALRSKNR